MILNSDFESLAVNNDTLTVIDPVAAEIQKIQQILIDTCRTPVDFFKKYLQHQFAYLYPEAGN